MSKCMVCGQFKAELCPNCGITSAVEQLKVQLAGCLTAAEGYATGDNDAKQGDYGWSIAFEKVKQIRSALNIAEKALKTISDLKDEAYLEEPITRVAADVVARNAGRIAKDTLIRLEHARRGGQP